MARPPRDEHERALIVRVQQAELAVYEIRRHLQPLKMALQQLNTAVPVPYLIGDHGESGGAIQPLRHALQRGSMRRTKTRANLAGFVEILGTTGYIENRWLVQRLIRNLSNELLQHQTHTTRS